MSATPAPRRVTLAPRLNQKSWKGQVDQPAPPCRVVDLMDALTSTYAGDVYILGYRPADVTADKFHRLSLAALAYYALYGDETMPMLDVALIDVDAPNHQPPAPGWAEQVLSLVPAPLNSGWYRTPNGLRIVVIPAEPVPLLKAASYLGQLAALLTTAGVPIDPTTDQWSRLFRAPRALSRDLPSDFSGMAPSAWHPRVLEDDAPSALGEIVPRSDHEYAASAPMAKAELAPLYKRAPGLAEALFRGRWQVAPGGRHAAVLSAAVDVVEAFETADPALVYKVIGQPAVGMLSDRPDARAEVIRVCEWACSLRSGRVAEGRREEQTQRAAAAHALAIPVGQVKQRLIVDAGKEFFVWDEQRLVYSRGYTHAHQLYGALKRHCPTLAGDYSIPDNYSTAEVYRDLSTPVRHVVFSYFEGRDGLDEERDTFYLRTVAPDSSLIPTFHAGVDRWLRELAGPQADQMLDWLAMFPRLDRPVCALYLDAQPSVGKEMLVLGLARLYSAESAITDYADLLRNFNEQLRYSPIVWADEKVPQDAFEDNDSSVFRRIVGKGRHTTEAKYAASATLLGYPRLIITANNADALGIREDMSPDDLEAVRLRLGYIRREKSECHAARVVEELAQAAGYNYARDYTETWVAGGAIARHVLWLAENREVRPGKRFLVEGWDSALTRSLAVNTGGVGAVATAIATAIAHNVEGEAVRWWGGMVYVSASHLGAEWEKLVGNEHDKCPHVNSRQKALKAMSGGAKKKIAHRSAAVAGAAQGQYWVIDPAVIAGLADERGICAAEEIVSACLRKTEKERSRGQRAAAEPGEERGKVEGEVLLQ